MRKGNIMVDIWFTSDSHFGHKNIIEYEKSTRDFENTHHMNEAIIERWNSVVRADDVVYHLGDFCFGRNNIAIAAHLNGRKRLILGNHDTYTNTDYLQYFEKLYGIKFWEKCILTHVPVHPQSINGKRCVLNVHGHLHSKRVMFQPPPCRGLIDDPSYFNVSVEQNNLYPINAEMIRERVRRVSE